MPFTFQVIIFIGGFYTRRQDSGYSSTARNRNFIVPNKQLILEILGEGT
jgi:hypothetical protein